LNCRALPLNSAAHPFWQNFKKHVATTPNDPKNGGKDAPERDLSQEMLMREVDEAVRTDEVTNAFRKFGWPVAILLVLGLLGFGGYLYWDASKEQALDVQSEALILAMDELEAGNLTTADEELAMIGTDASPGALASARMTRAAIALEQGRTTDAVAFYEQVVANADVPRPMRDAALVRLVAANFDNMDPQEVIDRLGPLAAPGNAWFGSAGELVAHAYLEQGKDDQAGPLLVAIAQDETVPAALRARTRQLAGAYRFDAIEDVEVTLQSMEVTQGEGASEQ
jgi:hypothetical protein